MKICLWLVFLLVLPAILIPGCSLQTLKPMEIGNENYKKSILIATQPTDFKKAVVAEIIEALKKDVNYIKVIDIKHLKNEPTVAYNAIVIVNTCRAWSLSWKVSRYLEKTAEKEKIILLTTANGEDWQPKDKQVDAVTSASKLNKVDVVAESIVDKVRSLLAGQI
jgi:hypothetical protein